MVTTLTEAYATGRMAQLPRVIGGRYGLSSKEFTPGMVKPVYDELLAAIEAIGARKDGVIRHHLPRRDGTARDSVMYSILASEWRDVKRHLELRLHRLHQARMPVSGVEHRDAAGEVDEAPALDVPDLGVVGALHEDLVALAQPGGQRGAAARHQGGIVQVRFAVHRVTPGIRFECRRTVGRGTGRYHVQIMVL